MLYRTVPFVLSLTVAVATPGIADSSCSEDAQNMLARRNCGFERDLEGWTPADSDVTEVARDASGDSGPGALRARGIDGSVIVLGPCVKVKGEASYKASARVELSSGAAHFCQVTARQYTDNSCEEGREILELEGGMPPTAEWQTVGGSGTTAASAKSVQLHLECNGEPGFEVLFDDVVLARP